MPYVPLCRYRHKLGLSTPILPLVPEAVLRMLAAFKASASVTSGAAAADIMERSG